jgi:glycosyltransferase involved in cell wall biosynthesis
MPVYNERSTLRAALERLLNTDLPVGLQVLVVDDGSTDGSSDTIEDLIDGETVQLLTHPRNRGKGAAIQTGIAHATGDIFTILDADLEVDPANYRHLLTPLSRGDARVVYGTRFFGPHNAYSYWYVIGHRFLAHVASLLFNTWLTDVYTCFKMAETDVWRALELKNDGFAIEAEITAKLLRSGERIHEVTIDYWPRGRADGKKIRWTDGFYAVWTLIKIRTFG